MQRRSQGGGEWPGFREHLVLHKEADSYRELGGHEWGEPLLPHLTQDLQGQNRCTLLSWPPKKSLSNGALPVVTAASCAAF
jgi:hypothetical protein